METAFILFSLILSFICVALTAFFTYKFNKVNKTLNQLINAHNLVADNLQKEQEIIKTHNDTLKVILDSINPNGDKSKDNTNTDKSKDNKKQIIHKK